MKKTLLFSILLMTLLFVGTILWNIMVLHLFEHIHIEQQEEMLQ